MMASVDIKPVDYNLKTVQSLYRQEVLNDNRFPVLSGSIRRSERHWKQEDIIQSFASKCTLI